MGRGGCGCSQPGLIRMKRGKSEGEKGGRKKERRKKRKEGRRENVLKRV